MRYLLAAFAVYVVYRLWNKPHADVMTYWQMENGNRIYFTPDGELMVGASESEVFNPDMLPHAQLWGVAYQINGGPE